MGLLTKYDDAGRQESALYGYWGMLSRIQFNKCVDEIAEVIERRAPQYQPASTDCAVQVLGAKQIFLIRKRSAKEREDGPRAVYILNQ